MKYKNPDAWHKRLYDPLFAQATIGSEARRKRARKEVTFLDAILRLPKGARILDVPCGTGRHSFFLAKKGYDVVGVDINPDCLKIARKTNTHKNTRYIRGNVDALDTYKGKFDAVVNLSTSFGYFSSDKKNEMVLKQLISALKPGGKLVINTINKDYLLSCLDPAKWWRIGKYLLIESRRYHPKTSYMESYFIFVLPNTHKASAYYAKLRLYSRKEMVNVMRKCGLKKIRVYGDFRGNPFRRFQSTHPYYVGEK